MISILKNMGKKEYTLLLLSTIQVVICIYLDLKLPDYMSQVTILVETQGSSMELIWYYGKLMLIAAALSTIFTIAGKYISSILAATFAYNLRAKVFKKIESFSMEEIEKFQTASLIMRTTNDVQEIQNFVSGGLQMIVRTPIMFVWVVLKIYNKHWSLLAITVAAVLVVLGTVIFILSYARPRFQRRQTLNDNMNKVMRENMTGIRIVRAYNAEDYQINKFKKANRILTQNATEARIAMGAVHPITRLAHDLLGMGIYVVGAYIIMETTGSDAKLMKFSEVVTFNDYAARLLMTFMSLEMIFSMLPRVTIAADRINQVLNTKPAIVDGKDTQGNPNEKGTIEFKNVCFKYSDSENDVISNINFKANSGETVAIIGATGSGKSTLVSLIPRFHDATSGQVLVNGKDVKEYTQHALHNLIGYASQKAILFTGTVRSNVDYGENARKEDDELTVEKAINIAQSTDFVEKLENGYDGEVTRGGTNLSGGQKQRLSVARTVFRKPQIYIFDDTFSALDYRTDRNLRAALKYETAGVTTIIVAQRIGTIRDADKILVMDNGKIIAEGKHEELLKNCDVYKEIALTQLSQEELG